MTLRAAATSAVGAANVAEIELALLLDAVQRSSGYDFRDFAPTVLRRRINDRMRAEGAQTLSGLQEQLLHKPGALARFIDAVTFNPSVPFREPELFATLSEHVIPRLRTFPFVRIWVAGCGAADDVYALAILLQEAEFARRVRIYATDTSEDAIERAKLGIVDAATLESAGRRYHEAGGKRSFLDYLDQQGDNYVYRSTLRDQVIFAQHNLATDGSFNEFHLILARTALVPFGRTLAYRAHGVLYDSLIRLGYLVLGDAESLRATPQQRAFDAVADAPTVFRRMR